MAGGKRIHVGRIKWLIMPDGYTAADAPQTGEADWLEPPVRDLVPVLEHAQDIRTGITNHLGAVYGIRLKHLQHSRRYARATEFVEVAQKILDS